MSRKPISWLLVLIAAVFAIAGWSIYTKAKQGKRLLPASNTVTAKLPSQVTIFPSDPIRGSADAPVTIIEFGDFACAYCAQAAAIINKVMSENPNKFKLIWKDFPLPSHNQAMAAAEAAQCAARQGKFWQYYDALWARQGNLSEAAYLSIVGQVGLDLNSFSLCREQHATKPLIELNIAEAKAIGVDGVPFFIINGQVIDGLIDYATLRSFLGD